MGYQKCQKHIIWHRNCMGKSIGLTRWMLLWTSRSNPNNPPSVEDLSCAFSSETARMRSKSHWKLARSTSLCNPEISYSMLFNFYCLGLWWRQQEAAWSDHSQPNHRQSASNPVPFLDDHPEKNLRKNGSRDDACPFEHQVSRSCDQIQTHILEYRRAGIG